jgi:hypothetical protein
MHPWIAEQANRQHVAELRSLGRPFGSAASALRIGRRRVGRTQQERVTLDVAGRRRRFSLGF